MLFEVFEHLETVDAGHHQVEQNQVAVATGAIGRLEIRCNLGTKSLPLQGIGDGLGNGRFVFYDQDF